MREGIFRALETTIRWDDLKIGDSRLKRYEVGAGFRDEA